MALLMRAKPAHPDMCLCLGIPNWPLKAPFAYLSYAVHSPALHNTSRAMAKKMGKCVHCLKDDVELTSDHMFPKSWYPDTTAENLEKWTIPSCLECNQRHGKLERDLIGRVALSLDANNPASKGLAEKALRAINPAAAKNEGDAAARDARAKKLLGEMFKGEQIKGKNVVPGLGERWNRPIEQQLAIKIPEESFPAITEKIVRGLVYREDDAFIEPPQEILCQLATEEGLDDVKALLIEHGKEFKREPGLVIRRAELDGGDLYEITFWDQFKTYATVQKPETPTATHDAST
jgi:hypothetical protein